MSIIKRAVGSVIGFRSEEEQQPDVEEETGQDEDE